MSYGLKTCETRSWATSYRGPLLICATKTWNPQVREQLTMALADDDSDWGRVIWALANRGITKLDDLPLGAALCAVDLVDVWPTDDAWTRPDFCPSEDEQSFGDYAPGRFAWITENLRRLPQPIPCKGAQGLWDVERVPGLAEAVGAALKPPPAKWPAGA